MKTYKFSKKPSRSVHILNPATDRTWCKLENSNAGKKLTEASDFVPNDRTLCSICQSMSEAPKARTTITSYKVVGKGTNKDFYQSWEWAQLRYEVLKKYGAICMLCGVTSQTSKIVVDHVKSRALYPELQLEMSNMQVLCDLCNRGKGRKDDTDWRDHSDQMIDQHMRNL